GRTRHYGDEKRAKQEVRIWLMEFANSAEGGLYGKWVADFLRGNLPLTFGKDPAEGRPFRSKLLSLRQYLQALRSHYSASRLMQQEIDRKWELLEARFPDSYDGRSEIRSAMDNEQVIAVAKWETNKILRESDPQNYQTLFGTLAVQM